MRSLWLVLAIALVSCESSPKATPEEPAPTETATQTTTETTAAADPTPVETPPAPSDGSTEDFDVLVRDSPREQWIDKWGPPAESVEVSLAEGQPEFRVELYNDFKPDDPATASVVVTEDTWDLDGYSFTLWSVERDGKLVALQAMSYSDDVEF